MAEFLLELYAPRGEADAFDRRTERAQQAAEELRREGAHIRFLRSILVPEDETCFYLYEAASAEAVREAARRAELPEGIVVEAVTRTAQGRFP